MNSAAFAITALVIVPAVALARGVWFALRQIQEDLRSFSGFNGLYFDL